MEFDWDPDDAKYRTEIRQFIRENLPSGWRGYGKGEVDEYKSESGRFARAMAERGWLTQSWPVEYGGSDASGWRQAIISEELWSIGEPRGPQYMNVNWIGPAIMEYGTPEQKSYHLKRISSGDVFWCQGFSEPDAGSDLASLRCRAVHEGDNYVVTGTKIWTSHVGLADFCFLLVRTDPEGPKHHGISVLLVPMGTPGIEVRHIGNFVEEQALHELIFDGAKVPTSCRLGDENEGWMVVRRALAFERVGAAHHQRALVSLDRIVEYAEKTGLISDPEIQTCIGEAYAACEAARVLYYRVVDLREKGNPPSPDANISRLSGTGCLRVVAELGHLVFGAEGLCEGSGGDDIRRVQTSSVAAGTREVQLDQIALRYLNLPKLR